MVPVGVDAANDGFVPQYRLAVEPAAVDFEGPIGGDAQQRQHAGGRDGVQSIERVASVPRCLVDEVHRAMGRRNLADGRLAGVDIGRSQ